MKQDEDQDLDLGWLGNFLQRHPEVAWYWMGATCEAYLLWQTIPGLLDPTSRWAYIVFLVPLNLMTVVLFESIGRLMAITRRLDERDRQRARLKAQNDELERKAKLEELERAASATAESAEVVEPGLKSIPHEAAECPGPPHFPGSDGADQYWVDEVCGSYWQWRGDRWVQA